MNNYELFIERNIDKPGFYEVVIYNNDELNLRWWELFSGTRQECKDFKENYDKGIEWISKGAK